MNTRLIRIFAAILVTASLVSISEAEVPKTIEALWSDFDPRKDPLDVQIVRQWDEDGMSMWVPVEIVSAVKP